MVEFDPDRVPTIKLGLHIAQIVIGFTLWVLEIAVFTAKGSKVVGNNGWTFAVVSRRRSLNMLLVAAAHNCLDSSLSLSLHGSTSS